MPCSLYPSCSLHRHNPWPSLRDPLHQQDYDVGSGPFPVDGQEVQFHYTAYNESGGRIDSSFNKGGGKPSVVRLGINGLIPGALL